MKKQLGEIANLKYGKMPNKDLIRDSGYPIFTGYKISGFYPIYMYDKSVIIIVARGVGGTGDVKIAPPKSFITNLSIIVDIINDKLINKKYLQLLLGSLNLRNLDSGSAQSQITIAALSKVELDLPKKDIQDEIASKIELIERKIQLNKRINDNLVELINLIYLKFCADFPAKEKVSLDDVFNTSTKTFNVNENKNINIWHFSIPNFDCNKQPQCESTNSIKSNKKKVNSFGVLVSKLNPNFKRIWAPNLDFYSNYSPIASPEFIQINGNSQEEQALIFCILNSKEFTDFLVSNATGSTNSRQRVKPKIAVSYIIPFDLDKKKGLESLVSPILKDIQQREFENTKLQIIKDTLLNKYF